MQVYHSLFNLDFPAIAVYYDMKIQDDQVLWYTSIDLTSPHLKVCALLFVVFWVVGSF